MMLNSVILAVEDGLSEVISTKILKSFGVEVMVVLGNNGNGYLRKSPLNSTDPLGG